MSHDHHGGGHSHLPADAATDRRWLAGALALILAFMLGEVVVGWYAHSLALLADAGHMLTDAAALAVAIGASRLAQRPARGAYTYGFARVDALSAQANGITMLVLAIWFSVQAVRRLVAPAHAHGGPILAVALVGIVVNLVAVLLAGRADRRSLNVRGALAHLVNDLWAFVATAVAGLVILLTGWTRADAVASLAVATLMVHAGTGLVRAAGRVFLEAAPTRLDPAVIGPQMAAVPGVAEVHDLHVWDLGGSEPALSAHLVVAAEFDCHQVAETVRELLLAEHRIGHATLQADHRTGPGRPDVDPCAGDSHGPGYVSADRVLPASDPVDPAMTDPSR